MAWPTSVKVHLHEEVAKPLPLKCQRERSSHLPTPVKINIYLSICLSIHPSIHPSIHTSIHLYLSIEGEVTQVGRSGSGTGREIRAVAVAWERLEKSSQWHSPYARGGSGSGTGREMRAVTVAALPHT